MKVTIRCYFCGHIHKIYDYSSDYVFIPQTLDLWIHMACQECSHIGHEIYIQSEPTKESEAQA